MPLHKRMSIEIPKLKHKDPVRHHVFVDTESHWSQVDGKRSITRHELRFGYAKYCKWNGHQLALEDDIVFHTRNAFWNWLHKIPTDERVWVWAHNIAFDGTLLGLWRELQKDDTNLIHFTDCDLPAFFQCQLKDRSYQFLDSLNIFKASLSQIGSELGRPKLTMPTQRQGLSAWIPYCKNDVDILHLIVEQWIIFCQTHQLGKMSPSLAGQSLTAYRTRFMDHPIHLHCHKSVTAMERDSYYGGLVEPRFIGDVPACPIYEFDINSLYPYVMKVNKFPNMLNSFDRFPTKDRFKKLWRNYYCIAHVKLNTTTGAFPVRINGRLIFPLGTYYTTLHHPELERALALGVVQEIASVASYTTADLFSSYVDFFYGLRQHYDKETHRTFHYICKLFLNALYGKFGQKRPQWERYSEELIKELEVKGGLRYGELDLIREHIDQHCQHELRFKHPYNDKVYAARRLLGVNQVLLGESESPWSFPAIAGAVTSYAREHVRNIQQMIGRKNLFYTDTDSFFVTEKGKNILKSQQMLDDKQLGKLKAGTVSECMTIYGPKDYETDHEVKRKGIRAKAKALGNNSFRQEQWPGFRGLYRSGFPTCFDVKMIKKRLKRQLLTLQIGVSGWTYPLLVQLNNYTGF